MNDTYRKGNFDFIEASFFSKLLNLKIGIELNDTESEEKANSKK